MSLSKPLLALMVMVSSVGFAGAAFATTPSDCVSDLDCAHGYTCQPAAVVATPTPATCAPDADCKTTEGSGAVGGSGVSVVTRSTCQPGPCATDSDCGADMVCHTETSSACSGGAATRPCLANTKCDQPAEVTPPTCTTTTTSRCAYRWQLPCSADTDCGSGFVCQPSVYGTCSGGSGTSGVAGGTGGSDGAGNGGGSGTATPSDAPRATGSPPDMCTTTTSFPGWCQVVTATCATDTDCPSNWLCQESSGGIGTPVSTTGAGATGVGGSGGATGVGGSGGAAESGGGAPSVGSATDLATIPTTKMCVAPLIAPVGAKDSGTGGRTGGNETGSSPEGQPTTGATQGTGTGPTVPPATGMDGTSAGQDSKTLAASSDGAGCSVIHPTATSGSGTAALLALFGLGLVALRRRRG